MSTTFGARVVWGIFVLPALTAKAAGDWLMRLKRGQPHLPLTLRGRVLCVAASGMGTVVYGVSAQPTTKDRVEALGAAVDHAVWRSVGRASRVLGMTIFACPQADPILAVSLSPHPGHP